MVRRRHDIHVGRVRTFQAVGILLASEQERARVVVMPDAQPDMDLPAIILANRRENLPGVIADIRIRIKRSLPRQNGREGRAAVS